MCGIVGYTGREAAAPIVLNGLSKLEYRGYDSAGVAVFNEAENDIDIVKYWSYPLGNTWRTF